MDSDACRAAPSFVRSSKNMMLSKGECVCVCAYGLTKLDFVKLHQKLRQGPKRQGVVAHEETVR